MATALVLDADGRRENGRWKYGQARESFGPKDDNSVAVAISKAGVVLDWMPDLAPQVAAGTVTLACGDHYRNRFRYRWSR
jgi:hypothetical protein